MSLEATLKQAEQDCKANGGRLTRKRRRILEVLLESDHPKSAYEIADLYFEKTEDKIPAMSVYRMLEFLITNGLVHKLTSTNKFMACTHISCNHEHQTPQFLICDNCQTVTEIGIDKKLIQAIEKSIQQNHFKLNSPQLELHGLCDDCQSK